MLPVKITRQLATFTLFSCTIAFVGCGKKQDTPRSDDAPKSDKDPKSATPEPAPPEPTPTKPPTDFASAKPDVTYTVKAFEEESKKKFAFLGTKHPGKVVEVTGVVKHYGVNEFATIGILESDSGIGTMLKLANKQPWLKALPRQTVTLRTFVPTNGNAIGIDWHIVAVTGPTPPTLTADDFVKATAVGFKGVEEKYGKGSIFVTGTVAEPKGKDDYKISVFLVAGKDEKVHCVFPGTITESQKAALKPGQKVKILGEVLGSQLLECILIEPAS